MFMIVLLAFFSSWNTMFYFLYMTIEYVEDIYSEVEVNHSKVS